MKKATRGGVARFPKPKLRCALRPPITQANELLYFPAFVTVFLCFDRTIVGFSEGVLGVTYDFCDQVQRFGHSYVILSQVGRSLIDAMTELGRDFAA